MGRRRGGGGGYSKGPKWEQQKQERQQTVLRKWLLIFFLLLNYIVDGCPQGLLLPRFPQWSEHTNNKNEIYFLGNKK